MSDIFITRFLHKSENNSGAMDNSFKFYIWIKYTALMLFLQIIWKIRQITDYFNVRSDSDSELSTYCNMTPLTKESKNRRHIRSMSDVQSSTPHKTYRQFRKSSYHPFLHEEERSRRFRYQQYPRSYRYIGSSDSSDYSDSNSSKSRRMERNIMKPKDSMRFL